MTNYEVSEFRIRNAYMYYNAKYDDIYNMYTCHVRATQALAWVNAALPRGLACHVASTWVPHKNIPLFVPFELFLILKN